MTSDVIFATLGAVLFGMGFAALVGRRHLLWRIIAVNIMASGVSLLLLVLPARVDDAPDPVSQAMVLTGIVVMVAATALALALAVRVAAAPADDGETEGAREGHSDGRNGSPHGAS